MSMSFRRVAALATSAALAAGALLAIPAAAAPAQAADAFRITPNPAAAGEAFEGWGTSLVWFANATGGYPEELREDLYQAVFGEDGLDLAAGLFVAEGAEQVRHQDDVLSGRPWRADGVTADQVDPVLHGGLVPVGTGNLHHCREVQDGGPQRREPPAERDREGSTAATDVEQPDRARAG